MANTDKKIRETSSVVLPCDKKEKIKMESIVKSSNLILMSL